MIFDEFKNKTILITGGGSGIGKALAVGMNKNGAIVGVTDISNKAFENMPEDILCYPADIRSEEQVSRVVEKFCAEAGHIDMLVNSAGVSLWKDFFEMDSDFWDLIYDVNVKGTFLVTQAVARQMKIQENGIIINVASMSGLKSGMPGASAYMSSKWAIVGLSRNLHLELKKYGIRVGCICPGSTLTELHRSANTPDQDKMMSPEDIAGSIMFMLAAPENGHVQLLAQPAFFEEWK